MFSFAERLILFNQYEILKKLDPEKSSLYGRHQEVVERGFESLYQELGVTEATVSAAAAQEMNDILGLFRAIRTSSLAAGNAGQDKFVNFAPAQAKEQFAYADFLSKILNFPQEISRSSDNQPDTQLEKYRKMLRRWDEIGRKRELTTDQIEHLVA